MSKSKRINKTRRSTRKIDARVPRKYPHFDFPFSTTVDSGKIAAQTALRRNRLLFFVRVIRFSCILIVIFRDFSIFSLNFLVELNGNSMKSNAMTGAEKGATAAAGTRRGESPMMLGVESKERPSDEFVAVCHELLPDMDADQLERAWRQYDTIGQQCVLEVGEGDSWGQAGVRLPSSR